MHVPTDEDRTASSPALSHCRFGYKAEERRTQWHKWRDMSWRDAAEAGRVVNTLDFWS